MKKSGTRGTLLITLITLVALVVIASVTCPDKVKHTNALSDKMSSIIADKTRDDDSGLGGLGMLLGNAVSDAVIKNLVSVDDYFLFSLGKVYSEGEEHIVSFGIFGHVFTASKDRIQEEIDSLGFCFLPEVSKKCLDLGQGIGPSRSWEPLSAPEVPPKNGDLGQRSSQTGGRRQNQDLGQSGGQNAEREAKPDLGRAGYPILAR